MQVEDLVRSGQSTVAVETLHAIIGMLTLQKGGDVASRFCREKILSPGSRAKKAVEVRKAAEKEVAEKKAAAAQEKSGDGVLKE